VSDTAKSVSSTWSTCVRKDPELSANFSNGARVKPLEKLAMLEKLDSYTDRAQRNRGNAWQAFHEMRRDGELTFAS
jgi:hypothetical protein